jgi:hypothetical protein
MLDEFRDDLVSYLGSDTADPERVVVAKARLRLTQDEADERADCDASCPRKLKRPLNGCCEVFLSAD